MRRLALMLVLSVSAALSCSTPKNFRAAKRGVVPGVVANKPTSSASNGLDKRLVCHLEFNATKGRVVEDSSGYANNGNLQGGAIVVNFPQSKCGNAAYTYCGDILFHGDTFQGKPREAVTIAAWVNLLDVERSHSIFDTIGWTHPCGQYHFEVNNGGVRWFHRNESQITIFSCTIEGNHVKKEIWAHITGTYDSSTGKAKIYVNGELRNMTIGGGLLSRDWITRAGIGDHKANRPLMGFIDDFRIYNYALTKTEIKALVTSCGLAPSAGGATPGATPTPAVVTTPTKKPFFDVAKGDAEFAVHNRPVADMPLNDVHKKPRRRPNYDSVEEAVLKRSHGTKNAMI